MTVIRTILGLNLIPASTACLILNRTYVTNVYYLSPIVRSQGQADAVYFDLSSAFDLVPHSLLLNKLSAFRLTSGHVNWVRSYISKRKSQVHVILMFSLRSAGICLGTSSLYCVH
jgi:hypothetical protein